jgi:hypothetical protein
MPPLLQTSIASPGLTQVPPSELPAACHSSAMRSSWPAAWGIITVLLCLLLSSSATPATTAPAANATPTMRPARLPALSTTPLPLTLTTLLLPLPLPLPLVLVLLLVVSAMLLSAGSLVPTSTALADMGIGEEGGGEG